MAVSRYIFDSRSIENELIDIRDILLRLLRNDPTSKSVEGSKIFKKYLRPKSPEGVNSDTSLDVTFDPQQKNEAGYLSSENLWGILKGIQVYIVSYAARKNISGLLPQPGSGNYDPFYFRESFRRDKAEEVDPLLTQITKALYETTLFLLGDTDQSTDQETLRTDDINLLKTHLKSEWEAAQFKKVITDLIKLTENYKDADNGTKIIPINLDNFGQRSFEALNLLELFRDYLKKIKTSDDEISVVFQRILTTETLKKIKEQEDVFTWFLNNASILTFEKEEAHDQALEEFKELLKIILKDLKTEKKKTAQADSESEDDDDGEGESPEEPEEELESISVEEVTQLLLAQTTNQIYLEKFSDFVRSIYSDDIRRNADFIRQQIGFYLVETLNFEEISTQALAEDLERHAFSNDQGFTKNENFDEWISVKSKDLMSDFFKKVNESDFIDNLLKLLLVTYYQEQFVENPLEEPSSQQAVNSKLESLVNALRENGQAELAQEIQNPEQLAQKWGELDIKERRQLLFQLYPNLFAQDAQFQSNIIDDFFDSYLAQNPELRRLSQSEVNLLKTQLSRNLENLVQTLDYNEFQRLLYNGGQDATAALKLRTFLQIKFEQSYGNQIRELTAEALARSLAREQEQTAIPESEEILEEKLTLEIEKLIDQEAELLLRETLGITSDVEINPEDFALYEQTLKEFLKQNYGNQINQLSLDELRRVFQSPEFKKFIKQNHLSKIRERAQEKEDNVLAFFSYNPANQDNLENTVDALLILSKDPIASLEYFNNAQLVNLFGATNLKYEEYQAFREALIEYLKLKIKERQIDSQLQGLKKDGQLTAENIADFRQLISYYGGSRKVIEALTKDEKGIDEIEEDFNFGSLDKELFKSIRADVWKSLSKKEKLELIKKLKEADAQYRNLNDDDALLEEPPQYFTAYLPAFYLDEDDVIPPPTNDRERFLRTTGASIINRNIFQRNKLSTVGNKVINSTKKGAGSIISKKAAKQLANKVLGLIPGAGQALAFFNSLPDKWKKSILLGAIGAALAAVNFLISQLTSLAGILGGIAGGAIGFVVGGVPGAVVGFTGGSFLGNTFGGSLFGQGAGGGLTASSITSSSVFTPALVGTSITGVTIMTASIVTSTLNNPLLTPIPAYDPIANDLSKYVYITKYTENGKTSFDQPENINYVVEITPKEGYTINITNITDSMSIRYNEEKRSEEGLPPGPIFPPNLDFDYMQGQDSITLTQGDPAGDTYQVTYPVEFGPGFQHARVSNRLEIEFTVDGEEGNQKASGSEVITFGDPGIFGCWPTTGVITQEPYSQAYCAVSGSSHCDLRSDAYDIASPNSPLVHSFEGGTVVSVGNDGGSWNGPGDYDPGYGYYIRIRGEYDMIYGHLQDLPNFSNGDSVSQGQVIGVMGNTGASSGPHLHFEITDSPGGILKEILGGSEGEQVDSNLCEDAL